MTWRAENKKRGIPKKAIITEERSPESVTSTMFIPDVVLQDEGGYYCSAKIGLMSALSQTAYLEGISKQLPSYDFKLYTVHLSSSHVCRIESIYDNTLFVL